MNDQSPPKRITRARAAAKTDTGVKIATAASKAKVTRNASTIKRKTRADDTNEEEAPSEINNEMIGSELPKTTRGRAKKAASVQHDSEPQLEMEEEAPALAATKPTRGRAKKAAIEAPALEVTRSTRGRSKKVEIPEEEVVAVVEEPPKKPTRARAPTLSKAAPPKKTVKFEEPDKENIVPPPANMKGKVKATEVGTGLKAKPVRKPAVTTRATRGRAKVETNEQKSSPLSPKKATQIATAREQCSDDELAANEKTPMKPLMKSPIKAPGSIFNTAKKLDFSNSITVHRAVGKDLSGSIMASPARRPPQSPFKESMKTSPQRSNLGGSLMKSPFKLPMPQSKAAESASTVNLKASLLQSPARRPQSPTKVSEHGSPSRSRNINPMISGATPQANTFKISRFATPRTLTKSGPLGQMLPPSAFKNLSVESTAAKNDSTGLDELSTRSLTFTGRLSAIIPREADPTLTASEPIIEAIKHQSTIEIEQASEPMLLDQEELLQGSIDDNSTTPPCSPPRNSTGSFALREVDKNTFIDSDSEDELASVSPKYSPGPMNIFKSSPATPTPSTALYKSPKTAGTPKSSFKNRSLRLSEIGFTPLARQLSDWMASSPETCEESSFDPERISPGFSSSRADVEDPVQLSPARSTFFEDEMSVRDEMQSTPGPSDDIIINEQNFTPVEIVEEDFALAEEADEMSLLETGDAEDADEVEEAMEIPINIENPTFESLQLQSAQHTVKAPAETNDNVEPMGDLEEATVSVQEIPFEASKMICTKYVDEQMQIYTTDEPALSEASQEYADENAIPIDPALLAISVTQAPATPTFKTPKRVLTERVCHTVSKVPLKAAAEDSPIKASPIKRSASISRLPAPRPSGNLARSNTVISYSPAKSKHHALPRPQPRAEQEDIVMEDAYATPSKSETAHWSSIGTPARTPRRDLNTALLQGAIVFVDVHTSEGADASSLFIELLTGMGARCVKSWNWNPTSDDGSTIGITHVVFKDGGKRTLEKAKQTAGIVTCVGVGWVLDCERENKWLPEAPYSVDINMVPRGGRRRRKSMEPRALTNLNGTLLSSDSAMPARKSMSPMKNHNSFADTPLTSKSRRRDSVQWVRSPSSGNDDEVDDETLMLSPLPATPTPEFISTYGEEGLYGDETPGAQTPYFLKNDQVVQQTAPVRKFGDFGEQESTRMGFLSEKKDESVLMRLMAARRKSLQWAPKVGSPLARGGEWH